MAENMILVMLTKQSKSSPLRSPSFALAGGDPLSLRCQIWPDIALFFHKRFRADLYTWPVNTCKIQVSQLHRSLPSNLNSFESPFAHDLVLIAYLRRTRLVIGHWRILRLVINNYV
ncbi:hypothetical protein AVEN_214942-1 [Araneus ventricosus]|uniref:Uncharacterized protein n=1 Tax=Araneus ventricosus TaxID=182803 RepID=A0A4Y2DAV4_ARAVE|nr:hypothetical protein AVEN_214942-1 [Araneus ventricosus]